MSFLNLIKPFLVNALVFAACSSAFSADVRITGNVNSGFKLLVDNEPFFVNGVGGSNYMKELKAFGGNCFRTWGMGDLDKVSDGEGAATANFPFLVEVS